MCGRRGAGNQEDPNVIVDAVAAVRLAPAEIVQGIFGRETKLAPEFVGEESVKTGAFVHFVEMRQRFAFK